ncbi:Rne/Rng family ribonuclease [Arsenicicoccus dermatophilus]|uniref:Rne/Rng family ribonuclease n=1 Tax=Arsenicicoccus dermatophilus TaxID=1076331 RepID=UPI003916D321
MAPDQQDAPETTTEVHEGLPVDRQPGQIADTGTSPVVETQDVADAVADPAGATPADADETGAAEAGAGEAPAAEPAPVKRATRARKTTATKRAPRKTAAKKAAAAPVPVEPDAAEDSLGTPGTEVDGGDARAAAATLPAEQPPARKRARRATKKAAAVESTMTDSLAGADAPETAVPGLTSGNATGDQPAAAADEARPAPSSEPDEAGRVTQLAAEIDAQESDDEIADLALTVLDDDELDDLIATIPVTPPEEEAPAPSSPFGLLFQAPDTTAVRRHRRATSPSVDPSTVQRPEVDERADQEASRDEAPQIGTEPAVEDGDDASTPRRRRRGGKGRRRGVEDELDGAGTEEAGDDEPVGDATEPETTDEGDDDTAGGTRRARRRRGRKGRGDRSAETDTDEAETSDGDEDDEDGEGSSSSRRRRRRRRSGAGGGEDDPPGTVTKVRDPRRGEATGIKGSTRLEAKKQRRREGREAGRRRTIITEAEFLARRESVERTMVVRDAGDRTQIAVLEDGVLVEHYVSREQSASSTSIAGNIYLGRVQNVLPSMEAAFVDIGKGRNAVLYAGEVNWDAAGLENGQARRIENALRSGDTVLVQATKDPMGHKGARLTSQISLPGRYLVFVPGSSMTGISRKLPDNERARLKKILKEVMPADAGVIVRTAAEGASEEELRADVARLTRTWDEIQAKARAPRTSTPSLLHGEPDLTVRVVRDVFNEDFSSLVVSGEQVWRTVSSYVESVAPDLAPRLERWTGEKDVFAGHRIDEQLAKAMDRKVWLPSGGSLVIDRTEAMTVIDVNTGKFVGQGGNLEETVTKNNIEAAEEIVRQLRLRDIGGIIVVDFIDMVLESNRDLVVRRLVECLGRDRTKHQVAEVTSLGLVQMTRKRVGTGLIESFSTTCEHCNGRGILVSSTPVAPGTESGVDHTEERGGRRGRKGRGQSAPAAQPARSEPRAESRGRVEDAGPTPAQIAAAAHAAAMAAAQPGADDDAPASADEVARAIDEAMATALGAPEGARPDASPVDAAEVPGPDAAGDEVVAVPAVPLPAVEPAPEKPRRRKRGRVVAPAGPPRPLASDD